MQHSYNAKFDTIEETIIKGRGYWRSNLQTVLPLKTFACRQEFFFSRPGFGYLGNCAILHNLTRFIHKMEKYQAYENLGFTTWIKIAYDKYYKNLRNHKIYIQLFLQAPKWNT